MLTELKMPKRTRSGRVIKKRNRRTYKKNYGARKSRRGPSRQVHYFKRRFYIDTITGDNVQNNVFRGYNFTLGLVPNVSDFTNLYDQYKIQGIRLEFRLRRNISNDSTGAVAADTGVRPLMYTVVDYDTSTTPASVAALREYANCKVWQFDSEKPYTRFFKPKVLNEVYRTAITTATAPMAAPWLSTTFTDAQHFGMQVAIDRLRAPQYSIDVEGVMYLAMKNTK